VAKAGAESRLKETSVCSLNLAKKEEQSNIEALKDELLISLRTKRKDYFKNPPPKILI